MAIEARLASSELKRRTTKPGAWSARESAVSDSHRAGRGPGRLCTGPYWSITVRHWGIRRRRAPGPAPVPGEEGGHGGHGQEADPDVHPQAEDGVGVVDAQRFDPQPAEGVAADVEGEEPPGPEAAAPFDPQEHGDQRQVPQRLVEERRLVGGDLLQARRPVGGIDPESP